MDETEQMKQIFAEGGIADDGMDRDPVSGNEVPPGSLAEEVRDDVDAKLSTGEYVVPADVVRYFGVAYFEKLRKKAKEGLGQMEEDGRIGGEPVMDDDDDFPFSEEELEFEDAPIGMAEGGLAAAPAFNPAQYAYGGGFPAMGGMGGGVETRTYVNASGDRMSVLFVNGQPVTNVPQGFVPDTDEGRKQLPQQATGEQAPKAEADRGRDADDRRVSSGEEGKGREIAPEENLFNMNEEQLKEWTKGGVSELGAKIGQGAGLLAGGPAGLLAGAAAGTYNKLEPLQRARTAAMVAEERGLTTLAEELNAQAKTLEEELKPGTRMLGDIFATGKNEFNRHLASYQAGQQTVSPVATRATQPAPTRPTTASSAAPRTPGGFDRGAVDKDAKETREETRQRAKDIQEGKAEAAGAKSPARDIKSEGFEGRGYTQGRATGGLVDKPEKHKTEKKARRRIKTVDK